MTFEKLHQLANIKKLILGSASPRRVELLGEIGVAFRQMPSGVEEHNNDGGKPYEMAKQLAEAKALFLSGKLNENELVIGADTVVELNGKSVGKPINKQDAMQILVSLSGKKHTVCTALAFADNKEILASGYELTDVFFNEVSKAQLENYIETGEPLDKAGAYGIQGMGGFLVDRIQGSQDNVVGLPRRLLEQLAGEVLVKLEQNTKESGS